MIWAIQVTLGLCSETRTIGFEGYPGKLLQNVISHGIARIAEFLTTDKPQVIAHGFVSALLQQINETEIVDELRVIISEEARSHSLFYVLLATAAVNPSASYLWA